MKLPAVLISLLLAQPALAEISVPSGQVLELYSFEVVTQPSDQNLLFVGVLAKTLDPQGYDAAAEDMDALCRDLALPEAAVQGRQGIPIGEVSIRIADQPLAYGEVDPEVAQFMGFYEIVSGECVWH